MQNQINELRAKIAQLTASELSDNVEAYKEFLDELYPAYRMGSVEFLPSQILESDPLAFGEGLREYIGQTIEDCKAELKEEIKVERTRYAEWLCSNQFDTDWAEYNRTNEKQLSRVEYHNLKAIEHLSLVSGVIDEDEDFSDLPIATQQIITKWEPAMI